MIDHTLDPLPRRTTRTDHDVRGGRIWFSRETINKARSYDDVSWLQVSRTAQIGVGLAAAGLLLGMGGASSLLILSGVAAIAINMPALILKAAYAAKAG
ncbi:hypothetical protein [uncultured Maricaulis sp.]|uniref:hypothetical protein n=1 Tax=uncultured Maricaulis sp. TaxID=174710 RepID=UPI00260DED43|nr:hypothetical protein [uncultured Maricaulis sp.]